MANFARILVIRLTAIGDVVLTLPAVSVLRSNFPTAKITFLTTRENAALISGFRDVDELIAIDRSELRTGNPWRMGREIFRLLRTLRGGKFSLAVDLQGNGESAWMTRITGAPQRWGVVHKPARRRAYTQSADRQKGLHAAEMQIELLRLCGLKSESARNEFVLPSDALNAARDFLSRQNISAQEPMLYIQPFTSSPPKNWPLENYLQLAGYWQKRGWQIIFGGGPGDHAALNPVRSSGFVISAGVPLLVTGGLMQAANLIVGGDTGALHLAVAQGKRVVMLMHHDRAGRPHPFRHPEWSLLPQVPLDITSISFNSVVAACESAIS